LRHKTSIGAPPKLRKMSSPVERVAGVEKEGMKPRMNTDSHG
jgi:hypothetical protein